MIIFLSLTRIYFLSLKRVNESERKGNYVKSYTCGCG